MTEIKVLLEFDGDKLGPKWMNPDNLESLLYTEASTKPELLRVVGYTEMAEWISVKDRLPEVKGSYLCLCKYLLPDPSCSPYQEVLLFDPEQGYPEYVTHWRKLPEPPEAEGKTLMEVFEEEPDRKKV